MKNFFFLLLMGFVACTPNETQNFNLVGNWKAVEILTQEDILLTPSENNVEFKTDGTVVMHLTINTCGGTFTHDGATVDVEGQACTEACCDDVFTARIPVFLDQATQVDFSEDGNIVTFSVSGGMPIVKLEKQ